MPLYIHCCRLLKQSPQFLSRFQPFGTRTHRNIPNAVPPTHSQRSLSHQNDLAAYSRHEHKRVFTMLFFCTTRYVRTMVYTGFYCCRTTMRFYVALGRPAVEHCTGVQVYRGLEGGNMLYARADRVDLLTTAVLQRCFTSDPKYSTMVCCSTVRYRVQ